eukprot:COSAG02_NODE_4914_length_4839_cov_2552.799367_3_plen_54_part_00
MYMQHVYILVTSTGMHARANPAGVRAAPRRRAASRAPSVVVTRRAVCCARAGG